MKEMLKKEFLSKLREALIADRINNVDSLIEYYNEMICDRMEDGMEEEAAVEAMGSVEEIVKEVSWDKPISTLVKQKVAKSHNEAKSKGNSALWIILLILGSPVWLPLAITLLILLLVLYMMPWILIFSIFAVLLSLGFSAIAVLFESFRNIFVLGSIPGTLMTLGGSLILGSITVMLIKPAIALVKGTLKLGKAIILGVKKLIFGGKK